MSYKNWIATNFNEKPIPWDEEVFKFLAYGAETCPTTGKKHWQTYFCLNVKSRISTINKKLKGLYKKHHPNDDYIHINLIIMGGSLEQNESYCSKEGELVKFGNPPKQGERTDLKKVNEEIKNGKTVQEIRQENPNLYHLYGRTLEKLEDDKILKNYRSGKTECLWIYGPTGTGKTEFVDNELKDVNPDDIYIWSNDKGWWDEYKQQKYVVMDDYRGEIPYNQLLKMTDKYKFCKVSRRGKPAIPFNSVKIFITSSLHPKDVYHNRFDEDSISQLLRRIEIKCTGNDNIDQ